MEELTFLMHASWPPSPSHGTCHLPATLGVGLEEKTWEHELGLHCKSLSPLSLSKHLDFGGGSGRLRLAPPSSSFQLWEAARIACTARTRIHLFCLFPGSGVRLAQPPGEGWRQ